MIGTWITMCVQIRDDLAIVTTRLELLEIDNLEPVSMLLHLIGGWHLLSMVLIDFPSKDGFCCRPLHICWAESLLYCRGDQGPCQIQRAASNKWCVGYPIHCLRWSWNLLFGSSIPFGYRSSGVWWCGCVSSGRGGGGKRVHSRCDSSEYVLLVWRSAIVQVSFNWRSFHSRIRWCPTWRRCSIGHCRITTADS